jgi:hypothetical protein
MSASTTHIVTNSKKREKEKMNQKLKQVIKSQTKAKTRSHEREKSRSPPKLSTPQGEAKGLDTIGKGAQIKSCDKELPKHEFKLPLNKCISPIFLPLNGNTSPK